MNSSNCKRIYSKLEAMDSSNRKIDRKDLVWTIKDLANHPEGKIKSVVFSAGYPTHSLWYMELHVTLSKTGMQSLSHRLKFLRGSCSKGYTYTVYIVGKDGKNRQLPRFNPYIKNCHFLDRIFFTDGSVTLRIRLTFAKERFEHTAHIEDVSTRIGTLRDMKDFCDLVLISGSEKFHVHKALLQQRCPNWLDRLEIKSEDRKFVRVSRQVLEAMLRYIYTGKFKDLPVEFIQEFYELAEVCGFKEFTKEIFHVDRYATLCTEVQVIRKTIVFDVDIKDAVCGKGIFKPLHVGSILFSLKTSMKRVGVGISVQMKIDCRSKLEKQILLHCVTSIAVDKSDPQVHPEVRLKIQHLETIDHLEYVYNKKVQKDSRLQLTMSFALSKGESTCSYEDKDLQLIRSPSPDSTFGMGLLSLDLEDLYLAKYAGDITCFFRDSGSEKAHKALLAASSPLLRRMLSAETGNSISLDMDIKNGRFLLKCIYSGEVSQTQVTKFISDRCRL